MTRTPASGRFAGALCAGTAAASGASFDGDCLCCAMASPLQRRTTLMLAGRGRHADNSAPSPLEVSMSDTIKRHHPGGSLSRLVECGNLVFVAGTTADN